MDTLNDLCSDSWKEFDYFGLSTLLIGKKSKTYFHLNNENDEARLSKGLFNNSSL